MREVHFYSTKDFEKDCKFIAATIKNRCNVPIKGVYGIPRGGIPLAIALSNLLDVHLLAGPNEYPHILVVDDIVATGKTRSKFLWAPFACLHQRHNVSHAAEIVAHPSEERWIKYFWEEEEEKPIEEYIVRQFEFIGEDPNREGINDTPNRMVRSWEQIFSGYKKHAADYLTTFESGSYDQMVLLKDVEFYSTCEHHFLPFIGKAHIAYIPNDRIIGISKLARLLEVFSRRLQIQERIGEQVTDALMNHLSPKAAACIIEAKHLCMCMRGVEKQNSVMTTSSLKGAFLKDRAAREELMQLTFR